MAAASVCPGAAADWLGRATKATYRPFPEIRGENARGNCRPEASAPILVTAPVVISARYTSGARAVRTGALPRQTFYIAALSLVLALSAFGAYLLWRDVRRELRVSELRSEFVSSQGRDSSGAPPVTSSSVSPGRAGPNG
jgi:hypothetical protein